MPKITKILSDKEVRSITRIGCHRVGGVPGLLLRVTPSNHYWVLRYVLNGKRHDFQFGDLNSISVKEARNKAAQFRRFLDEGIDPKEYRRSTLLSQQAEYLDRKSKTTTFRELAEQYYAYQLAINTWAKNPKDAQRFESRLKKYVYPTLGNRFYHDLQAKDFANALSPIYIDHPSTAEKVRHIIKMIYSWAIALQLYDRANPIDGNVLRLLLPKKPLKKQNHPMLPVASIPEFMADLHQRPSISAKCLEFAILTASRSANAREAMWAEIDWDRKLWTIPAEKMKMPANGDHVVPLSDQAISLLKAIPRYFESPYIFCSPVGRSVLSDRSLLSVLDKMCTDRLLEGKTGYVDPTLLDKNRKPRRITAHGTARASFRTWAQDDELGNDKRFSARTAELCLHHKTDDSYDGAYERNKAMKSRREMMQAWADYCLSATEKSL